MTEDAKFSGIQAGIYGWFWDAEKTTIARVTRDGSGTLWANWGDGCGSDRLPEGPAVVKDPPINDCADRCEQRGVAIRRICDELQVAVAILIRQSIGAQEEHMELLGHVVAAHGIAMAAL